MKKTALSTILFATLCLSVAAPLVAQEKRVAFVIGNAAYPTAALANPANDAADVAAALTKLGFKVRKLVNASRRDLRQGLDDFARDAAGADFALFYYAGHGVQAGGQSYLVPIDANLNAADDIEYDCVEVSLVSAKLESARPAACAILLDACRDNPFRAGARSLERGLGVVARKPPESMIMYATGEGSTAADGTGRNGVFTASFLRNVARPGLDIWALGNAIRTDVKQATGDKQIPALYINLEMNRYYLAGRSGAPAATIAAATLPTPPPTVRLIVQATAQPTARPTARPTAQPSATSAGAFINSIGMSFVQVPAGTMQLGSGVSVSLSAYRMAATEVTQGQYQRIMGNNPSDSTSGIDAATRPVEVVSWYDALVFCNKLSMAEGLSPAYSINGQTDPARWGGVPTSQNATWDGATLNRNANGYRLPTEAEWEYAARGGPQSPTRTATYAGSNNIDEIAWIDSNSGLISMPVASKKANNLGLYDMSGNVWEWCWDWYNDTQASGSNPTGPTSGTRRVVRGGSFYNDAGLATVSFRTYFHSSLRNSSLGFRLVLPEVRG